MREELFHIILGILIPFLGTTIGAGCVFFVQKEIKPVIQKMLLGFASGIMVAGLYPGGSGLFHWYAFFVDVR